MSLLIYCLSLLPLFVGIQCLFLVLLSSTWRTFYICKHLDGGKERWPLDFICVS